MLKFLRKLFCRHCWINVLRLGGEIKTIYGVHKVSGNAYVDYCPKCNCFRVRHYE